MRDRSDTPNFHPDYCYKIVKRAAIFCSFMTVAAIVVLGAVDPSGSRCPGWIIHAKNGSPASLWFIFLITPAFPTAVMWRGLLGWEAFAQKVHDTITGQRKPSMLYFGTPRESYLRLLNCDQLFVIVCLAWCGFSTILFWVMIGECTELAASLALLSLHLPYR